MNQQDLKQCLLLIAEIVKALGELNSILSNQINKPSPTLYDSEGNL